ncbi:hypothetical protein Cs7R123_49440 [Catellatospora sp. TT07R-123]|uniref:M14 family zinc carboxypeptidase n=1 Tax=Catellatospora sp. TT07R-123 TaxID=2733863 RepID=UPI001B145451|nr:M14 family zinc carboxypeptidase [Catellatospora sp. TT07R-123]GHJ47602.1 hypothetical protein Cs7R123_49440 [Catellatospora sp. TT07R-123]
MRRRTRTLITALVTTAAVLLTAPAPGSGAPPERGSDHPRGSYTVRGLAGRDDLSRLTAAGAAIDYVEHGTVYVTATDRTAAALRAQGLEVTAQAGAGTLVTYPRVDAGYTTYPELLAAVDAIVAAHPGIAKRVSIGRSAENRDLVALKISDNVATDEAEPELLFTANQHAREHLTVEQALYLAKQLTDGYAADPRVTAVVDSREIWIVPMVNPDGVTWDFGASNGRYRNWRLNRQPNADGSVGTDLNRNWGYQWACCPTGSTDIPGDETYHGTAAFSAPETAAIRDFVTSRVVGGKQQIKAHLDIHTYSELVIFPASYSQSPLVPGMAADDRAMFQGLARGMADRNGYVPGQSSIMYIADGEITDWMWFTQHIASFTFEMYPGTPNPGFYPPASVIPAETARNRDALLFLIESADCPYRVSGKETTYCTAADDLSVSTATSGGPVARGAAATVAVTTAVTAGSAQPVTFSVLGLPPGATASFSPATVTAGGSTTLTVTAGASSPQGLFPLTILGNGTQISRSAAYALTVQGSPDCTGTNDTDTAIPDPGTINSVITVTGCAGKANAHSRVEVHIRHDYVGDLTVSLVRPDGVLVPLHRRGGDGYPNIDTPYVVDLSAVNAAGTWRLRVNDAGGSGTGLLDSWTLTL